MTDVNNSAVHADSALDIQDTAAAQLLNRCRRQGVHICCAESLTGGLLADAFVRIPGASDTFLGSVNTYAVAAKSRILGVDHQWLEDHGPVNVYTAEHMATGALRLFSCDGIALSTTGVAGPGPDGDIPAGTVYVGCALSTGEVFTQECHFSGNRPQIRRASVVAALELALRHAVDRIHSL
ncbi:CinA family protein [Alloscardovia criceti]|uniref:CinA family protein n=1 Tax=Alloscardovia criceti TaxID=356828 RepID=UPI0003687321|nr:CinA family protein [Alloscardovia criceti]